MAELAQLREAEESPDNRIRAREAALEGSRAYPQSPGASVRGPRRGHRAAGLPARRDVLGFPESPLDRADAYERPGDLLPRVCDRSRAAHRYRGRLQPAARGDRGPRPRALRPAGCRVDRLDRDRLDYKPHRTFVTPPLRGRDSWWRVAARDFAKPQPPGCRDGAVGPGPVDPARDLLGGGASSREEGRRSRRR
jgi:hypothetical protein